MKPHFWAEANAILYSLLLSLSIHWSKWKDKVYFPPLNKKQNYNNFTPLASRPTWYISSVWPDNSGFFSKFEFAHSILIKLHGKNVTARSPIYERWKCLLKAVMFHSLLKFFWVFVLIIGNNLYRFTSQHEKNSFHFDKWWSIMNGIAYKLKKRKTVIQKWVPFVAHITTTEKKIKRNNYTLTLFFF